MMQSVVDVRQICNAYGVACDEEVLEEADRDDGTEDAVNKVRYYGQHSELLIRTWMNENEIGKLHY